MGQEIITGYTGTRHITPGMDAAVWRGIFGTDSCIVDTGNQCAGSMPNINEFLIRDGVVSIQGYLGYGTQETLTVDTCATGFKRIDLVCARYAHDLGSLIDSIEYVLIKGAEVAAPNVPTPPAYNQGIIADGANLVDFPLYQINLDGGTVTFEQVAGIVTVGGYSKAESDALFVHKAGDAMTGPLEVGNNSAVSQKINRSQSTTPSSNVYASGFRIVDMNDIVNAMMQAIYASDGAIINQIAASKYINGSTVTNWLRMRVNNDETQQINVSDANAWRKGLDIKDRTFERSYVVYSQDNVSIAAGADVQQRVYPRTTPPTDGVVTGFTAVNLLNAGTGGTNCSSCFFWGFYIDESGNALAKIRNTSGSVAKVEIRLTVIYIKEKETNQYT